MKNEVDLLKGLVMCETERAKEIFNEFLESLKKRSRGSGKKSGKLPVKRPGKNQKIIKKEKKPPTKIIIPNDSETDSPSLSFGDEGSDTEESS